MFGIAAAYVVVAGALLFSLSAGLTWIYTVDHLDAPEQRSAAKRAA
jgi:hypothetical protein